MIRSFACTIGFAAVLVACAGPVVAPKTAAVTAGSVLATPTRSPAPASSPLSLVPADVARSGLVATFVAPGLERSIASGVTLVRLAAPLPIDAAGVRDMLLAQAGLPPEVARHVDLGAPIAGAAVAAGPGRSPLSAFTFAAKSAVDVAALLEALGRVIARRGAAVEVETRSGDRGWFLPFGTVVVFADTEEALVRAGSLAIEARREAKDDLSVVVYPDALARAVGTDVKSGIEHFLGDIEEVRGRKLGPEALWQLREMATSLEDVTTAEFAIGIDPARGASFSIRLRPKAGSKLQAATRITKTVPIDPLLLGVLPITADKTDNKKGNRTDPTCPADDMGFVIASAYGGRALEQIRRQRAKLPANGGKSVATAGRLLDALAEGLTGEFSMVGRGEPGISGEVVYPVRDAAAFARLQSALLASDRASLTAWVRAATQGEDVDMKVVMAKPESLGKTRALHAILAVAASGDGKGLWRKLVGPSGLDVFVALVAGDRLAVTMGQDAKRRMAAIVAGGGKNKRALTPELAGATAGSPGRSLLYFFDLRQAISIALAIGGDPRLRMLATGLRAPMPFLGGATGDGEGQVFTLDLTVPPSCFAGMGALVQAAILTRN